MNNEIILQAEKYRESDKTFADWANGYGVIKHSAETQVAVYRTIESLSKRNIIKLEEALNLLKAADRITNAAMWLVVHMTYANCVYLDGRKLESEDFKTSPEGHTGGALNIVPAYVGYLLANALCGTTRAWLMGQGHCVAAIDSVNLLVDNMLKEHSARYSLTNEGLTKFVRDFYSYEITIDGRPASPLGSHVNPHTAGGLIEGGYLGFAELLYPHMPLPGEELVVFLSDGAFEEQRGSDWASRWWRPDDSGAVIPIMIANGRRIDQRTTMLQEGGVEWFRKHLKLNGFAPYEIDGKDPASFACEILSVSEKFREFINSKDKLTYPIELPYGIAETIKGYGFPGAGTNAAHNLPLGENPSISENARNLFNQGAQTLWVSEAELILSIATFKNHQKQDRPQEKFHPLTKRNINITLPEPDWQQPGTESIPMHGIDNYFVSTVKKNPLLRPRVGNPDELSSNRMTETLSYLKHRVTAPETGISEDLHGAIITALNEEAVIAAALGNKGGINIAVSYEAFAVKMLGALRQEIIFSRHQKEIGESPYWLSVPVVSTSHTWENGKNEQSHQDPTLCEALMSEMSDVSRVVFPADYNTASETLRACYNTRGAIWNFVIPKAKCKNYFSMEQAKSLLKNGGIKIHNHDNSKLELIACGAYQLEQILIASCELKKDGIDSDIIYILEPGKFRIPRDNIENNFVLSDQSLFSIFNNKINKRVFVVHGHPEVFSGILRRLDTGINNSKFLGYINRGGTLDTDGMLFANHCTARDIISEAKKLLDEKNC